MRVFVETSCYNPYSLCHNRDPFQFVLFQVGCAQLETGSLRDETNCESFYTGVFVIGVLSDGCWYFLFLYVVLDSPFDVGILCPYNRERRECQL